LAICTVKIYCFGSGAVLANIYQPSNLAEFLRLHGKDWSRGLELQHTFREKKKYRFSTKKSLSEPIPTSYAKLEGTFCYLPIEVDDTLAIFESIEVKNCQGFNNSFALEGGVYYGS